MSFVNPLGEMLLIYVITLYLGAIYLILYFLKGEKYVEPMQENIGFSFMILGALATLYALYMNFVWPINIPDTPLYLYNMQFGEPYLWFGVITLVLGYSFYKRTDPKPITYVAFFAGIFLFRYAYNFLEFGLTRAPLFAFLIYFFAAIAAILLPIWAHTSDEKRRYVSIVIAICLLLSAIVASIVTFGAIEGHIAEALASS